MYRPQQFAEDRRDVLLDAIRTIRLAALVNPCHDGIAVTHAPVVVTLNGGKLALEMHVARANPHWRCVEDGPQSVAIFQGPHAYVSPSFYPSKKEHGKVVPTWLYIAVHAHGVLETMSNPEELARHLELLTDANESGRSDPWRVDDAPKPYLDAMKQGIVGLRLTVDRLEGVWKINQHKADPDWRGTAEGLYGSGEAGVLLAEELRASKAKG